MKFGVFLYFFYASFLANAQAVCTGTEAFLDLGDWKIHEKKIIQLDCKWEFYWNKLLSPQDFKKPTSLYPDLKIRPSVWSEIELENKKIGSTGYATYKLTLKNLPNTDLILDAYSIQTSYRIFIDDKLMAEVGKPGVTKEKTVPANGDVQIHIPAGKKEIQLIVQVANFYHRKGGFVHQFELGTCEAITSQRFLFYS